ncbi:hypothetical protein [Staphylococcus saprophyticus]|uniref:hypothetical protein n=1 Tax=Staphylococcus saprophyticus TaxID=29385 RepID=UPI000D1F2F44|nr:hypothetical protein [Staphylococcus saprophyticus]MDK1673740.1 hypothetical protein [Staphylococcus saprophyticus]MDW4053775.1 hypothetical protein [Staphylococcus saprophyticus]MDW4146261.1 hypothetical protein [Staphylococcus saprophyticus]PTJ66716.1 hypothetical protein BUZ76_03855 [Staphylococcus saprophyticus]PTK18862.1 hypothetical protein BUZ72_09240 [Staphylococcus saprophyticus]
MNENELYEYIKNKVFNEKDNELDLSQENANVARTLKEKGIIDFNEAPSGLGENTQLLFITDIS